MKIIISRKGFDSGTGGCPSPVFPDDTMLSLPIPGDALQSYGDITTPCGDMGGLVSQLTKGKMEASMGVHLDPDLSADALPRLPGWTPSLGQTGAAQSHLASKGVGEGDLFLFFGWFKPVEQVAGQWRYVKGAREEHVLFGYLQIGKVLPLGARPDTARILAEYPWLEGHPHLTGERSDNNTLYLPSPELVLDGRSTGLPGAAPFATYDPKRVLTAPEGQKSFWAIPEWLMPSNGGPALSYHGAPERWSQGPDGGGRLQSVAKGQEFVFDAAAHPQALDWVASFLDPPAPQMKKRASARFR